tara:strand:- start:553 stop:1044 length:492 start_codon:yes stop_codon:yes gene_type:complete
MTLSKLNDSWTQWIHLPNDTNWGIDSYKKIASFEDMETIIKLLEYTHNNIISNCMLFIMRQNIIPSWEDKHNRNGGCFSYKVSLNHINETWKILSLLLVGETLTNNNKLMETINGISISPKKNFCIIKIWLSTCKFQDSSEIENILPGINKVNSIFKKHSPEF